jgi:glutamyl-tRNA reductase
MIDAAALLSTCYRTEVYAQASDLVRAETHVRDFMARHMGLPEGQLQRIVYAASGEAAARHLMRVSAGLDSLILGENEILGQVRSAYQTACSAGTNVPIL